MMTSNHLTKSLGLLIRLEWGVKVKFNPPFLTGVSKKGNPFKILCKSVSHDDGIIRKINTDSDVSHLFLHIQNKSGNNLVILSNRTTNKLLMRDVSMREMANGIVYKNELEL